jgi:type II secretory pathway pseudopilin PulG
MKEDLTQRRKDAKSCPVSSVRLCALAPNKRGERGYALVGLMVVMLVALILTAAAAPAIKYEVQREREEEMLWRGHQIQRALQRYAGNGGQGQPRANLNRYPTELRELVEGVTIGTQKV